MLRWSRARRRVAPVLALALLAGCSSTGGPGRIADGATRLPGGGNATSAPPGGSDADACPARYREPDPNRPVIKLGFEVADDDVSRVTGTQHVEFTPDLPVTELVFRL